jgi:steroid 5-alpha reductase family enzyme
MLLNRVLILGLMFVLWLVSIPLRDARIIDPFWGLGFVLLAWSSELQADGPNERAFLLAIMTTMWGVRLAGFLTWRNWGQGEDRRYQEMREHHGSRFTWISLFTVFGLQAILLWVIAMPLQVAIRSTDRFEMQLLDVAGVVLWLVGVLFESVGDWQLSRFKADPHNTGRVMDQGLWRYTRHPNYFGDFCVWWGLYLVAAAGGAWWTMFSPVLMSVLLLQVSGVTLLEKDIKQRRPDYERYQRRTSSFFPWPPKGS